MRWNETTDKWEFTDGANTYTMARTTDDLPETSGNLYLNPTNLASTTLSTNLKVKHFSETVAELGNISGNVTIPLANGSIANATLTGNVETISFSGLSAGSRASIILNQDSAGNHKVLTPDIPAPTGGS